MKKPVHKNHKHSKNFYNRIIIGGVVLTVVLIIALVVANAVAPGEYIITADGHVHTADGAHVGEAADMFGEDYVITEDGHVHTADGTHVGNYEGDVEDDHDHAEDEAPVTE